MPFNDSNVVPFAKADIASLVAWINAVAFEDWPQQHRWKGQLRPAMVNDLGWQDFGKQTDYLVSELLAHFPNCCAYQRMLSVVMPGQSIESHVDEQISGWVGRVHVPLTTNIDSKFIVEDTVYNLKIGMAYLVNVRALHAVENFGLTPRIHFMFDVAK